MNACRFVMTVLLPQAVLGTALAEQAARMIPTTTKPIVYTINYGDKYFKQPDYIDQFKAAPPDLLHMGKAVPISHHWGPTRLYRGENQYTGGPGHTLSWENIALLSPEALAERIENIRRALERYHAIGIREITPYISYHTLAGDHEKREGFWKFYDNWDKYSKWAGTRPTHDPLDWLVVDKTGKFVGGSCGGYSPDYFAPLHRYRACIDHPDWAEWHRRLIRMIAEVGYDGCFVDNTGPDNCYCRYSKAAFRKFLAESRNLAWVARLTEGLDVDKLGLDSPDVPPELVRRFRMIRTGDHMAMLRRAGREVKPSFTIFPNGNSLRQCLVTGGQCDRLMLESTYSPGLVSAGEPPASEEISITVSAEAVEPRRFSHRYELNDRWMEMEADISMPANAQVGKPVELEVKLAGVGASDRDNDYAEDFYLLLRETQRPDKVRLPLEPAIRVGAAGPKGKGKRPPVTLKSNWTPERPGCYAVHFGFTYTDTGHMTGQKHSARLVRDQMYRGHMATLLFIQHMKARCICLGYEACRKGFENVQELGLAELAAFSGGGGFSGRAAPQAKYRAFFKKYPELFDGWKQTAPAAVLYAYWGGNPLAHVRPVGKPTIQNSLAGTHRPYAALLDATLPNSADKLTAFRVIYLESPGYEMSDEQLQAFRKYLHDGGRVVLADRRITINGRLAAKMLGADKVAVWDWSDPLMPTEQIAPTAGRQKGLRFAVYGKGDRLAVHVLNYNVCLLDKAKQVLDVAPTPLAIPLPDGWEAVSARCFDPDAEPRTVPCSIKDGRILVQLPKTHIYKIVLLERIAE